MEEGVVHFIPLTFTPFLLCQIYLSHVTPTALNQAGRHMEDSIVASYTALLLGILAKHNPVSKPAHYMGFPAIVKRWQSHVEFEDYFAVYFNCIVALEKLYC